MPYNALPTAWALSDSLQLRTLPVSADIIDRTFARSLLIHCMPYNALPTAWASSDSLQLCTLSVSADIIDRTSAWSLLILFIPYNALPTAWASSDSLQLCTLPVSADIIDRTSAWSLLIHCMPYNALPTCWALSDSLQLFTFSDNADIIDRTSAWSLLIHCMPYNALPTAWALNDSLQLLIANVVLLIRSIDWRTVSLFLCSPTIIIDNDREGTACPLSMHLLNATVMAATMIIYPSSSSCRHCKLYSIAATSIGLQESDNRFSILDAMMGRWRFKCRWDLSLDFFPKMRIKFDTSHTVHPGSHSSI